MAGLNIFGDFYWFSRMYKLKRRGSSKKKFLNIECRQLAGSRIEFIVVFCFLLHNGQLFVCLTNSCLHMFLVSSSLTSLVALYFLAEFSFLLQEHRMHSATNYIHYMVLLCSNHSLNSLSSIAIDLLLHR